MAEWEKFKVGNAAKDGFSTSCRPFDTVSHTSHVDSAINILRDREIRPTLVFDESKLNDQRILVSWLSPNYWGTGFRYGNIHFNFKFDELIAGKQFFWVEAIAYKVKACRILVTDIDHSAKLEKYNPAKRDGPWWHDPNTGNHYYNGDYCLEFMFETSIKTKHLQELSFVNHHTSYCSVHRSDPAQCSELGLDASRGAAVFLAQASAASIDLSPLSSNFLHLNTRPNTNVAFAFNYIRDRTSKSVTFSGSLAANSPASAPLARSIMSLYASGSIKDAGLLCAMFDSEESFAAATGKVFAKTIGLNNWQKLLDF